MAAFFRHAMIDSTTQSQSMKKSLARPAMRAALVLTLFTAASSNASAFDYSSLLSSAAKVAQSARSHSEPLSEPGPAGKVEVGFSPDAGAFPLVLKVINSSSRSLDVMAYSFTSAEVTRAILNARKRGVHVRVVADEKQNMSAPGARYAQSALSSLISAGAEVRINGNYSIFHDKVIISDGVHVQTGSFNYSKAAANSNSENVVVLWGAASVASQYSAHFKSRWNEASIYTGRP
ncbi:phospholipase D family protein [Comamonas thiooxydans]|nr:phospholipase D family protein [Comamonas thiooxydans]